MPFLLLDDVIELERGRRAVCRKFASEDEPFFENHFPGFPIVPGVLLIEAMAQVGGWIIAHDSGFQRYSLLGMVDHAKFRNLVRPGDEMRIESEVHNVGRFSARSRGRILVDGKVVTSADLTHHIRDFSDPGVGESIDKSWFLAQWERLGGLRVAPPAPPEEEV